MTTDSALDLKPCPFCGGVAMFVPTNDDIEAELVGVIAQCCDESCEVYSAAGPFGTEAEAAKAWNRRNP